MKTKLLTKYTVKTIIRTWLLTLLFISIFGALITYGDIRSEVDDIDKLINEFGSYADIPSVKIKADVDFSPMLPVMFSMISVIIGGTVLPLLFGIAMQMSADRHSLRKAYFTGGGVFFVLGSALFFLIQNVIYRIAAGLLNTDYPILEERCHRMTDAKYLIFYLSMGFLTFFAGSFITLVLHKSNKLGIFSMLVVFILCMVGSILHSHYAGEPIPTAVTVVIGILFAVLVWKMIMKMSLEGKNLFAPVGRR